jgi:hypothetical protein
MRLTIELTSAAREEIEVLASTLHIATKTELLNCALTLLQWSANEVKKGNIIASIDEQNGRYKELRMPALSFQPE